MPETITVTITKDEFSKNDPSLWAARYGVGGGNDPDE